MMEAAVTDRRVMPSGIRRLSPWLVLLAFVSLSACSNQALRWEYDTYTVRSGDTLYGIAWHFGLDHRDLARWNQLGSGDVIYPGQRLRLKASAGARTAKPSRVPAGPAVTAKPVAPPKAARAGLPLPDWRWPAKGPVIAAFGNRASVGKGIDIGGAVGQPVTAAAAGRVVYAGSGLVGYGQLIIVKHNEKYLSAYAHNSSLLVKQGDAIATGQRIAEMGVGPGRRPMLHFEIRVDGEAVDPIRFLPKR